MLQSVLSCKTRNKKFIKWISAFAHAWRRLFSRKRKQAPSSMRKCADSHHSALAQSLIRAFTLCWNILWYPMILFADSVCPDQTAQIRRLILTFAVRICQKTCFRMAWPKWCTAEGRCSEEWNWPPFSSTRFHIRPLSVAFKFHVHLSIMWLG